MRNTKLILQARNIFALLSAICLASIGLLVSNVTGVNALPPDGPASDYPGSSSSVWPTQVSPGETLNFTVSGFPPNEVLAIKIDDGNSCSDTSHGACVYHMQRLDGSGSATGSFTVPNIPAGAHWLRMLSSKNTYDKRDGHLLGHIPYSRRGGNDFVIVEGAQSAPAQVTPGAPTTNSAQRYTPSAPSARLGQQMPAPGFAAPQSAANQPTDSAQPQQDQNGNTPAGGGSTATLTIPGAPNPNATQAQAAATSMDSLTKNVSADQAAEEAKAKAAAIAATSNKQEQDSPPVTGIIVLASALLIAVIIIVAAIIWRKRSSN